MGKADDTEEETGKCTPWYRRRKGPGIRGRIRRDNVGKIPLAAGAGSNLRRLLVRGQEPKARRGKWDWRMSPWYRRRKGPGIRGRIRRDNVGKIPLAAGAGSNLRILPRIDRKSRRLN